MNQRVSQAKRLIEAFIALMVGRRAQVHWDGSAGVDNDGGIHLPPPQTGDADEIALLTRLAVHEGGHLVATEKGFADRLTREELAVFNVLEDPRMERSQVQRYPGASLVLSRGLDGMLQRTGDHLDKKLEAEPETAVQLDILLRGFLAVAPHGPFARYAPQILERIAPRIAEPQRAAIAEALAQLPMLASSLEAEDVARAFVARMREGQQPQELPQQDQAEPPEQEQEQQDQSQPGQPPAEQSEQEQAGDPDGAASQQDQPPSEPQAQDADGQQPDDGSSGGSGDEDAHDAPADATNDRESQGSSPPETDPSGADSDRGDDNDAPETDGGDDESQTGTGETGGSSEEGAAGSQGRGAQGDQPGAGAEDQTGGAPGAETANGTGDAGSQSQDSGAAGADGASDATASGGQPHAEPAEPHAAREAQAGEPFDLGRLLREAHVARYGGTANAEQPGGDEQTDAAGAALTEEDLQRVEALLAQADPNASLDELVEASLVALAASDGESDEDSSPGEGAGMSLAAAPTAPGNLIEARLQGVQSRLVTVLQRELQDKRRRPTRIAYNGSRVMPQRFWRLDALGDTKVMLHRRAATGIDAAATVLLDSSGSMTEQLAVAAQVTMAFSLALQRLGVRTRVARFPGRETITETLQRFGESARSCVHRCGELTASGGTPVGAAVAIETPALLQQRKLKNILAVVTDDEPGDSHTLLSAMEEAAQLDVLVVGVGIGCDIRRWIAHSVSVQDVNELPEALARLFRENITEKLAA